MHDVVLHGQSRINLTFPFLTNNDCTQPGYLQFVLRPSYNTTIAARYYLYLAKQSNSATEFRVQYPPVRFLVNPQ